jgi:DNA-binding transcriptional LysR family regulator
MDMNRLHYFCTIVKAGSLVKASELLLISQPALSKAIKVLEQEVNQKLIIPSGRGIAVTDYGKALAIEAEILLEKIENLKSLGETRNQSRPLSIATFEVFSTYFLGKVIASEFSSSRVRVFELTPGRMEEAIASGIADIGITYLPIPHADLDILNVSKIDMGIYGATRFLKTKFEDLPFAIPVAVLSATPSKVKGLDGWPDHMISRKIQFEVEMMETALDLCRKGLAVGYFPSFVIDLHNESTKSSMQLVKLESPTKLKKTSQDVYMLKRKSDLESKDFKKIARVLRNLSN